jgi:hypothetical protein
MEKKMGPPFKLSDVRRTHKKLFMSGSTNKKATLAFFRDLENTSLSVGTIDLRHTYPNNLTRESRDGSRSIEGPPARRRENSVTLHLAEDKDFLSLYPIRNPSHKTRKSLCRGYYKEGDLRAAKYYGSADYMSIMSTKVSRSSIPDPKEPKKTLRIHSSRLDNMFHREDTPWLCPLSFHATPEEDPYSGSRYTILFEPTNTRYSKDTRIYYYKDNNTSSSNVIKVEGKTPKESVQSLKELIPKSEHSFISAAFSSYEQALPGSSLQKQLGISPYLKVKEP